MREVENSAVVAISRVFGALPHVTVREGLDGSVALESRSGRWQLHPVWIGEGFPQDVRRAMGESSHDSAAHTNAVMTANKMSTGARQALESAGVSWADMEGNAHIETGDGLFVLTGSRRKRAAEVRAFLWTESAGAVAEMLLHSALEGVRNGGNREAGQAPRPALIAATTGWSYPQVGKILQQFDAIGYTRKVGPERGRTSHRTIADAPRLLSEWASWYRRRPLSAAVVSGESRDPQDYVRQMESIFGVESVAISGWLGLDEVAPFMTTIPTATVYVEATSLDAIEERLVGHSELRLVDGGGRLTLLRAEPQVLTLSSLVDGRKVVSPIRLYGDLLRLGVRGDDAADHLRETRIGF
ncbi:hypothetical protein E3T61_01040 [Cryobacterium lactosi]|uniref:Uncharacterized protein n=1 Tax=Cryobacterium lactosi TaxID=1259202 RepID=A0A4R9C0V3_9MICO|nr:type IV toxin-antitoxin system AbiEi family antitoxin [Cryobacterium lactosi]TFD95248.1 hypothetical protein E3T61_01040 [Cryobacterium lactosi]